MGTTLVVNFQHGQPTNTINFGKYGRQDLVSFRYAMR